MNPRIRTRFVGCLIALACWCGGGSATAQIPGLYKDGVLVEPMPDLLPAANVTENLTTIRLPHPARELSSETVARNLAGRECASALGKLQGELGRLHAAGRKADAGERQQLAALRAEVATAADKLVGLVAAEEAKLRQFQLPPEILERHAASLALMQRNKDEFLAAIDAAANGDPGSLAAAAALAGKFKPKHEARMPAQPTVTPRSLKAPRLTREAADALLAAKSPANQSAAAPPKGLKEVPSGSSQQAPVPSPQGDPPEVLQGAPPVPGDLAETVEIKFTPEITAKAAALGNSPLAIYEFVRNRVEFQPYLGSRKGAAGTLTQLAGNDTDQAALLMALLRVSGIPCRYVRGTVEMTPAQAANWLGVDDPGIAGNILTTAGLDGVNIMSGANVTAIRCTRVWVEAYIPYTNYRGIPNDTTGKTWIPLDPAYHGTVVTPGEDVLAAMAFNTDAFLADYISTFHAASPLEKLRTDIQAWLDSNEPGKTVAGIERTVAMDQQHLGLLPASIPGRTLAVASRFSALEDNKRYKVRFLLYDDHTDLIDHTLNLSDLMGRQVTIDYIGATSADQSTIDSYGGIYQTPPNLVNVKPRLKFDGIPIVTSSSAIGMGRTHYSDIQFIQPAGDDNSQPWIYNQIIAGNSQAVAFNTFSDLGDGFLFGGNVPAMTFLEMQLHGVAADYLRRVDAGIQQTGRLMRAVTTQDVSEAIVESAVSVTTSWLGNPVTFEWTGLTVDADRRIIGTFPVDGDETKEVPIMLLAGYDGSIMENRVFEDTYNQQAVSTVKILELSSDRHIPVYRITPATGIPSGFSQTDLVSAINTALSQGHHIIIPRDAITVGEWHGTGYINLEPDTGAAGYIISGGISGSVSTNGGATVQEWLVFLPCRAPTVRNDPADPICTYYDDPSLASKVFNGCDIRHIRLKGSFLFKCENRSEIPQYFNKVMSLSIKAIADDPRFGGGNYQLILLSTILLEFKIVSIEVKKVEFTSDHGVLTDYNRDYGGSGGNFYVPRGWEKLGNNNPVTHTRDSLVNAKITVELKPAGVSVTLIGESSLAALNFEQSGVPSAGSDQIVPVTSKISGPTGGKLPNEVGVQEAKIQWSLKTPDGVLGECELTEPLKIYVLCGPPGDGPTLKRVNRVVTECQGLESESAIVEQLWNKVAGIGAYRLNVAYPNPEWKILDGTVGECIAIANLFKKTIEMVGLAPGDGSVMYLYADANGGSHESASSIVFFTRGCAIGQNGHDASHGADHAIGNSREKLVFEDLGSGPGSHWNNWEACYKYRQKPSDPYKWYAAGLNGAPPFDSVQAVMTDITKRTSWYYVDANWMGGNFCVDPGPFPEREPY